MQTDPIGYADGMNWYAYVGNDPVNGKDPTGMCKFQDKEDCGGWLYEGDTNDSKKEKARNRDRIANRATKDDHLTHGEANEIWRANEDPTFGVTVDASKLTVLLTADFNKEGRAVGRIVYSEMGDWLVHGSVSLSKVDGLISITPGQYDFQPHAVKSFRDVVRNVETFGGFFVASKGGFSVGTDYTINYSGSPNVVR